jgi:hypothetical protein
MLLAKVARRVQDAMVMKLLNLTIEKIVNRMSEIFFATEVAFGRLYRRMSQEELNLLNLAAVAVAELRTRPPLMPHAA